jgi:hypothetical protein
LLHQAADDCQILPKRRLRLPQLALSPELLT